jgi:hypothetical protein
MMRRVGTNLVPPSGNFAQFGRTKMFARVTQFKMKPGTREAATAKMNELKSEIMGMPGMHCFTNVMNDDGTGYVISVVESEDISNANAPKVAELWGHFAEFMEAPPTPAGFDVIAHWDKG